jgi:hypothetical protein
MRSDHLRRHVYLAAVLTVIVFALGYAASPVVVHQPDHPSYMYYRHWAFILPMIALVSIAGLAASRAGRVVAGSFVLLNALGVFLQFAEPLPMEPKVRDTGFVLALKLGHDPPFLGQVIENVPELANELFIGAGWGTAEELLVFNGPTAQDRDHLIGLLKAYPPLQRALMVEGVEFAFARQGPEIISMGTRKAVRDALGPNPP